jgi:rhodanese-related sulfurtransferase
VTQLSNERFLARVVSCTANLAADLRDLMPGRHASFAVGLLAVFFSSLPLCGWTTANAQPAATELPAQKRTTLGLYVTAREAYEMWRAAPNDVIVLDVRTTEEFIFVGHAAMALSIPLASQTYEWDAAQKRFRMEPNPDFVSQVAQLAAPTDTLLVMCRSGGRSAAAVNALAQAGFRRVYNITDGMEGDPVVDPESVFRGKPLKNGWKNSGLPWTYDLEPERMRFPNRQASASHERIDKH